MARNCARNPPFMTRKGVRAVETPRKYVYDVTAIGQRSCKLHFASAQFMLRQLHLTNVSESIEAKY